EAAAQLLVRRIGEVVVVNLVYHGRELDGDLRALLVALAPERLDRASLRVAQRGHVLRRGVARGADEQQATAEHEADGLHHEPPGNNLSLLQERRTPRLLRVVKDD